MKKFFFALLALPSFAFAEDKLSGGRVDDKTEARGLDEAIHGEEGIN